MFNNNDAPVVYADLELVRSNGFPIDGQKTASINEAATGM